MKVSARNVFKGTVSAVTAGAVNAEVVIQLSGGDSLVAIVTQESVASLGLAAGKPALALVKAPWVMLMTEGDDIRLSARNSLKGKVSAIEIGAVNAEVTVTLAGGSKVSAILTREAVAELGLADGVEVTAIIKASHVIVGVPV